MIEAVEAAPANVLPRMYLELKEVLAETLQDKSKCEVTLKLPDGTVKTFANLEEVNKYANTNGIR